MSLIPKESEIPSFSSFPDITPKQKNKKSLKSKKRDESEDEQSSDRGYNNNEYINKDYRPSKRSKKKKEKDHSRSSEDDRSVSNKKRGGGSRYERTLPEQSSSSSTILEQEKKREGISKPIEKIPKEFRHLNPFKPIKEKEAKKKKKEISEEFIREKIKYFNVQLDLNPYDINLWLEFIEFQEKNSQFGKSKKADAADIRLSINEVKLSIFERALEANPNNPTLLSAYMKCCEQIWDVPKLLTKWDQILKENSRNIILWMQYLNFRQTNLVSFTVSQCIQVFEDCLHLLRKETLIISDPNEKLKLERIMIHVFHRACFFMYQSGYTERAYSCWQAVMELIFFVPENLQSLDFYDRLIKFESFWEAEWSRFGEDGAKGWSYYEKKVSEDEPHDMPFLNISQNVPSDKSHEGDIYEKWVNSENIRDTELLSIRTSDELEIEDPYRVTLFDDIRTFLFDLTSPQSRKELIYACFSFAGFTFNPGYSSSNPLITDTFLNVKLANESIANINFWMTTNITTTKITSTEMNQMNQMNDYGFKFPVKTFPPDGSNIFSSQNWFSVFDEKIDIMSVNIKFVRNVIYQLQQTEIDKDIKLCMLSIEYLFDAS
ncbi:8138_t:CDS:10, partial [Diversispora eburnea]